LDIARRFVSGSRYFRRAAGGRRVSRCEGSDICLFVANRRDGDALRQHGWRPDLVRQRVGHRVFFFPPKFSFYIADPLNQAELGFFLLLAVIASKAVAVVTEDGRAMKRRSPD
jgi:hypothetical protein